MVHGEGSSVAASDGELRELLDLATEEVPEPALAAEAWEAARRHRRTVRRRGLLIGAVVVAGGAVAATVVGGGDAAPGPPPEPTGGADGRLESILVAGARVYLAPDPRLEPGLPLYPEAARMALPQRVGPGVERPLDTLSPAGSQAPVRAVYLVRIGEDRYQPAVFLPRQSARAQVVAMAALHATEGSGLGISLDPRTIDADRHRLVFPQPGEVVILEVRSARTRRIPVHDDGLTSAGWATDGRTVVASSGTAGWLVDTVTGDVARAGQPVNPGWAGIGVGGGSSGRARIQSFSGRGQMLSVRSLEGPDLDVYGSSVSNTEGWACRGAYLGQIRATGNRMQGLVAVQGDLRPAPRILAAAASAGVPLGAYRPLDWGPADTVLLESRSLEAGRTVLRVLAWDVIEDRLYRVADVDSPVDDPAATQAFTGAWML